MWGDAKGVDLQAVHDMGEILDRGGARGEAGGAVAPVSVGVVGEVRSGGRGSGVDGLGCV